MMMMMMNIFHVFLICSFLFGSFWWFALDVLVPNAPGRGLWRGVGCCLGPLGMVAQPWAEKVRETAPEKMSAWFSLASAAR